MDQARSLAEMGAVLYGGEPPAAPTQGPVAQARSFDQIAAAQYDKPELPAEELPPEVKALRDSDQARAMYDDRTAFKAAGIDKALGELGIEGPGAEAEHKAWAGVFTDAGLTPQDAQDVVKLALMDEPTADEAAAWPTQAEAALQEAFGADDWRQALADARLLVKRDPRVRAFLNRTGLGDHPTVVKLAAQRARALIANGKLKRT